MKTTGVFISVLFAFSTRTIVIAANLPSEVLKRVPTSVDLESVRHRSSKIELEQLVKDCGSGVVKGAVNSIGVSANNSCSFQVELDPLFFEPLESKTGLLVEKDWAYQDGVQWFVPVEREVPSNFDLREMMVNGIPEIKKQQCGDCWAWSSHHGLEIARAVHDGKVVDHSVQTVLSCSRAGSCNGGYMKAVDFLLHGLPEEADFPYAAYDKQCKYSSSLLATGWEPKMLSTPYVGDSKRYSLAKRKPNGNFREGTKVKEMMAAMYDSKVPLVVTVAAYSISGDGIYNSCSSINSSGNHMVAVVGWDNSNGKTNAHVWNSWGKTHGDNGVSKIQWECGDAKLNRGLGVSAKVVQYKPSCVPPDVAQVYLHEIKTGESVKIGAEQKTGVTCQWAPIEGLIDPTSCSPMAKPNRTTEYHLSATNACGTASSMTLVSPWGDKKGLPHKVLTPHGEIIVMK